MSLHRATKQQSPTFLAPGTGFMEENFSMDWGCRAGGYFQDDSSTSHVLYILFQLLLLHQFHLRSSGIRSQRLGTPAVTLMEPSLSSGSLLSHLGPELPR